MKLYSYWRSSCSYRVRIALALKKIDVDLIPVHLVSDGGEQYRDEYSVVNPMQQVPALETDDGVVLTQSMAIIEYLEERFPSPSVYPKKPQDRARAREMAEIVNAGIQPLQNLAVLRRIEALGGAKHEWGSHFISQGLAALEKRASRYSDGIFLVGDVPSVADMFLIPQLYNARRFNLDIGAYPRLAAVESQALQLEAFQHAHPDRQPDAPEPVSA